MAARTKDLVVWPLAAALLACGGLAHAGAAAGARIYVCTDANGKRLTSDRPIPECLGREQRLLNPDGSTRTSVPPPMTAAERAAKEARDRDAAIQETARLDAIRGDRYLLNRYPDEAAHQRAREKALDGIREAGELSKRRMAELAAERKAARVEAEFYESVAMPPKLRHQLEANEAATASQRTLIHAHEVEAARINARFDAELERLRRLWSGAPAGSLGPLRPVASAASAAALK